jgi:hypothetical protein
MTKQASMNKNKISITVFILVLIMPVIVFAQWTSYDIFNSPLQTDFIISLAVDPSGRILIGTQGRGLYLKDGDNWRVFNQSNAGVPINYPFVLRQDVNTMFIGSASGNLDLQPLGEGLSILNLADSTWATLNSGLEINHIITGIEITPDYRAVATYGGGLTIFTDSGWTRYQTEFRTEFVYADSEQQTFKVPSGTYLPTDYIKRIAFDPVKSALWIATLSGGAVTYINGTWHTYDLSNSGLPSNRIQIIQPNLISNKTYFGTFGLGLAEKSGSNWTVYNTGNSPLSGDFIYSLAIRPDNGDLWIGTNYGLSVLDTAGNWFSYIPGDSGLVWGDFYSDIAFDSAGNVWVSTFGGGLASRRIIFEPPPPPQDTLAVEIQKLKFFLRSPSYNDITWLNVGLQPLVALADTDTVAVVVSSGAGQVYSWNRQFDSFHHIFHWRNTDLYFALVSGSTMLLRYRHDLNSIRLYLLDWQGQVNRDNIQQPLEVRIKLGKYVGHAITTIGPANPAGDPDADTLSYDDNALLLSSAYAPAITDIEDESELAIPEVAQLPVAYPNPFNPVARISFSLTRPAQARLTVYDILGRQATSIKCEFDAGDHSFYWDGSRMPSGVYYYILQINKERYSGKMTLLK